MKDRRFSPSVWDAQPLGTVADYIIADKLGCTAAAVYYQRKARGIKNAWSAPVRPRLDPETIREELGTMRDHEIAKRHGLSYHQVGTARRKLGIPSTWINWDEQPLGTVPDIVLAKQLGVDNKSVARARWRRGIAKWQEKRPCPCGDWFIAFNRTNRFCSGRCQRYWWHLVKEEGLLPTQADIAVAMAALRRTLKKKGALSHVEKLQRPSRLDSQRPCSPQDGGDRPAGGSR